VETPLPLYQEGDRQIRQACLYCNDTTCAEGASAA